MTQMYIGLHAKCMLSNFNHIWTLSTDFSTYPSIIFHKNPPSGSQVVPHGRMERWTDRHNEAKSPFAIVSWMCL